MIQMCYAPAILTDTGTMVEWVKYSAYGVPYSLPAPPPGDQVTDSDGDWDATDDSAISGSGSYDVRQDADLNGKVESDDITHANSITGGYQTLGRWLLGADIIGNRRGYAGYEFDPTFVGNKRSLYHVRHRVYDAGLGRWTRRDPLGYVDGMGLFQYVQSTPVAMVDFMGLCCNSRRLGDSLSVYIPAPRTCPVPSSTQCAPGYYYDASLDQCVIIRESWGCAARSTDNAACYACCNGGTLSGTDKLSCYSYCNERFFVRDHPPFIPSPNADGPCHRESSGHTRCGAICRNLRETLPDTGDGIMINNENGRMCCICDLSNDGVRNCDAIADCVSERMSCFAFLNPNTPFPCRVAKCMGTQISCLRDRLRGSPAHCEQYIQNALSYLTTTLKDYEHQCALAKP